MPDDDCKWGLMPFTDRQQKTHYALGLFLHPFGVETPLLIGQLSSLMSPKSLSPFCVLAQFPLARLSSTSIRSTRCTLLFILVFMDLWKCRLPSIIVPRTIAYSFSALHASVYVNSIHVFIVSTILKVVVTDWPDVAQKPMVSCFGCGSLVARCSEPGRGWCDQEQGWSRAPRGRRRARQEIATARRAAAP
jgi:hypothetical protein